VLVPQCQSPFFDQASAIAKRRQAGAGSLEVSPHALEILPIRIAQLIVASLVWQGGTR
jgi:hypothetical protein